MTRAARWLVALGLVLVGIVGLVGCTSLDRPSAQGQEVTLPTPLSSVGTAIAETVAELQGAVSAAGSRLDYTNQPYRPSEPAELLQVPRVNLRADLADPEDGFVVVYEAADPKGAVEVAGQLADYLGSGFGLTNYAVDAQFSLAVVGRTVVFTNWSQARSSDPDRAETVFDAVASVGDPVAVDR